MLDPCVSICDCSLVGRPCWHPPSARLGVVRLTCSLVSVSLWVVSVRGLHYSQLKVCQSSMVPPACLVLLSLDLHVVVWLPSVERGMSSIGPPADSG